MIRWKMKKKKNVSFDQWKRMNKIDNLIENKKKSSIFNSESKSEMTSTKQKEKNKFHNSEDYHQN